MSVIGSNILAGASGQGGGYNLTKSLRFRRSASGYLNRTPASAGNRKTWTWSAWVKLGSLDVTRQIFGTGAGATHAALVFEAGNTLFAFSADAGQTFLRTSQVFRDPSAWYHVVWAEDTTQGTASNRSKLYVNGVQITAFSTANYPSPDFQGGINNNVAQFISSYDGSNWLYDGYLTEVNFIDGQALTPSSFGETSTTTGVWIPKKYTGTYGTNGFYLPFTDTTSTSTLGTDFSGNSNTWTVNNISLTSGSTYDSMNDVPTLTSATTANYPTINPLDYNSTYLTLSAANLQQTYGGVSAAAASRATMTLPTTGKWYWEVYINATGGGAGERIRAGITSPTTAISGNSIDGSATSYLQMSNGQKRNNSTDSTYGSGFSAGQYIQVLYDATAGAIYFGQNGSYANGTGSFNQAFSGATAAFTSLSGEFMPCFITYGGADIAVNFGQQPFAYTPPTGFVALNTFNLPTPTIGATASTTANEYFDVSLYTGNSGTQSITNSGSMQPDFVWLKSRSNALDHGLFDSVRGVQNVLASNGTGGANYGGTGELTAFNSNGFTLVNSGSYQTNQSGYTYVAWQWRASNATAVTNTAGSITSTVSANTTAGFSIVTYTSPNSSSNQTVGHGLGVKPSMIIVKNRDSGFNWDIYHSSLGYNSSLIFTTAGTRSGAFGAEPTSTVFTTTNTYTHNGTDKYVAYCFAQVAGYSAFGSYTGNGDPNGAFVYLGFRPKFVLIKSTASGTNWVLHDSSREPFNEMGTNSIGYALNPENSVAESTNANLWAIDFTSNGFKNRSSSASVNSSGQTYIYMAFAENPFKYANAR